MKFKPERSDEKKRVKRCELIFESTVEPQFLHWKPLRRWCKKLRGSNLVYLVDTDDKNRLRITFASGFFNGRRYSKRVVAKSAFKILNTVSDKVLMGDPTPMAVWLTMQRLATDNLATVLLDSEESKSALKQVRAMYDKQLEDCYQFVKAIDREIRRLEVIVEETT